METPGDEDRIVPEAGPTRGAQADGAGTSPFKRSNVLAADGHRHATNKTGLTAGFWKPRQRTQQLRDVRRGILGGAGKAGRPDAGASSQRSDLQAGILRQDGKDRGPGGLNGFLEGVGPEGGAVLLSRSEFGELIQGQQPNGDPFQKPPQFFYFVPVPGRE